MMWPWQTKATTLSINQVIDRLEAVMASKSGISVSPENCMRSPTVHAIVTAVSRRVAVSPVSVLLKSESNGRTNKEPQPNHPVTKLLNNPNDFQTKINFWLDLTSQLLRYGSMVAFKSRGLTGPIRRLIPIHAGDTRMEMKDSGRVFFRTSVGKEPLRDYRSDQIFYARSAARDFMNGDSPILDIKEAISMEIAAEEYGASFYGNGAMPLMIFEMMDGFKEFKTIEEKREFLQSVKDRLGGVNKFSAFLLPKGMQLADRAKMGMDHEKQQFIDSRKYQRTVIAGAFGVPPHLIGDLERATFNNVEQQDSDFTINVILPYVRIIEAALERDLLTPTDRARGIIIRFNLDAIQRADFKSRQEGMQIQRLNGIISSNEWREHENMNGITPDDGGDDYWMPANYILPGDKKDEGKDDASTNNGSIGNQVTEGATD